MAMGFLLVVLLVGYGIGYVSANTKRNIRDRRARQTQP